MSKRKAGVNDIIYELDNDDIEISSEDEAKEAKKQRCEPSETTTHQENNSVSEENSQDVINLDCSADTDCVIVLATNSQNGGKTTSDVIEVDSCEPAVPTAESPKPTGNVDNIKKVNSDCSNTTILNEDIVVDSPASNTDLGVVGCENRTPLVTVRFKDKKLAKNYKQKVKMFMLSLIQLHDEENLTGSETETDLELDVWPEDLLDDIEEPKEEADNLFFVDTAPGGMEYMEDVPTYRQNATMISNVPVKEATPPLQMFRRGPTCFNCDGAHSLRDCRLPRNNMRINEKRKTMVKTGRYHVEDDQKYGHLVPGRISGQLRHALGLKRHELPLHIYRMRMLGYPPGWLEEARISHSGITMFDSSGQAILDPDEEEGEVCEPGSKDKFDIKKILDFPGFNVPPSSRYKDEAHLFGMMPMSEQDSKLAMLQMLAPNAMKAYKRKKLTMFPSASNNNSFQEGQVEMELDSGDETADFPSVPPLPDEAPPPAPPPPPPLPPPDDPEQASSDLEVIEVIKVNDIPVPVDELITIDEIDDNDASQPESGRQSPSLDDLEEKKKLLLNALQGDVVLSDAGDTEPEVDSASVEIEDETTNKDDDTDEKQEASQDLTNNNDKEDSSTESQIDVKATENVTIDSTEAPKPSTSIKNGPKTPTEKTGHVKTSEFGTPVMNIASSYTKLPTDEKFAKDICDVINFENLPNSTGKYKKISSLLKKVKSKVDRIQDS